MSNCSCFGEYPLSPSRPAGVTPALHAVSPNPLRGPGTLRFAVADRAPVRLEVYDVTGRRRAVVVDEVLAAGEHEFTWDGTGERGQDLAAGVYFLKLVHSRGTATQKMVVAR